MHLSAIPSVKAEMRLRGNLYKWGGFLMAGYALYATKNIPKAQSGSEHLIDFSLIYQPDIFADYIIEMSIAENGHMRI
jgi:hypothetical protein